MYQLICTSYNETKEGLVLRNNWIETVNNDEQLLELVQKWNLPLPEDFKNFSKNTISNILEGKMVLYSIPIHVRIVCF